MPQSKVESYLNNNGCQHAGDGTKPPFLERRPQQQQRLNCWHREIPEQHSQWREAQPGAICHFGGTFLPGDAVWSWGSSDSAVVQHIPTAVGCAGSVGKAALGGSVNLGVIYFISWEAGLWF